MTVTQDQWMEHAMAKADRYANVAAALAGGSECITQASVDGCRAKLSAHLQQRPLPVREGTDELTLDERYWVRRRVEIIEALAAEGLQVWSDRDRVWLHRLSPPLPVREEPTGADAERYRWLRHAVMSEDQTPFVDALEAINLNPQTTDEFDATVDAARAASPSVQNSTNGVNPSDGGER